MKRLRDIQEIQQRNNKKLLIFLPNKEMNSYLIIFNKEKYKK